MSIQDLVRKYNGGITPGAEWWPDGAIGPNEMIIDIPKGQDMAAFVREINALLHENNPVQPIAHSITAEFFLYYSNAEI